MSEIARWRDDIESYELSVNQLRIENNRLRTKAELFASWANILTIENTSLRSEIEMGRGKRHTQQLTCRVDVDLLEKLKSINPSLVTHDTRPDKELKFRHGALGKYITRLIAEDILVREDKKQEDILEKFSGQS